MNWDIVFHGAELTVLLIGVAWPVTRTAIRLMDAMKDFPPHRHEGNSILYPKGFEPARKEKLNEH